MISVYNMNNTYQDIITAFVFNTVLHHVGMLWIIETYEQIKYDVEKHYSHCMTFGTQYNTYICKKIHGKVFEGLIRNEITDRYIIICSIDAHEKIIHQNMMMETAVISATINLIGYWIQVFEKYIESCHIYIVTMK